MIDRINLKTKCIDIHILFKQQGTQYYNYKNKMRQHPKYNEVNSTILMHRDGRKRLASIEFNNKKGKNIKQKIRNKGKKSKNNLKPCMKTVQKKLRSTKPLAVFPVFLLFLVSKLETGRDGRSQYGHMDGNGRMEKLKLTIIHYVQITEDLNGPTGIKEKREEEILSPDSCKNELLWFNCHYFQFQLLIFLFVSKKNIWYFERY